MSILVQKYGGTSVGSIKKIKSIAQKIADSKDYGHDMVIVVSAMGNTTNELTKLAKLISPNPSKRELDMLLSTGEQVTISLLSMALNSLGIQTISMTGIQVGIITESSHSRARILRIQTDRIRNLLNDGMTVVIAGFQGTSLGNWGVPEITTLGRGGSDTSAVALAASLEAERCEIYTDVPGVLTTDPKVVPEAQLMKEISCDEMLELASLGAEVLHPRSVEIAQAYGVPVVVKSSWEDGHGTLLTSNETISVGKEGLELNRAVKGLEIVENQAVLGLSHVPDKPGIAADLFEALSKGKINVDLIIQSVHEGNSNDITFTISENQLEKARLICNQLVNRLGGELKEQEEMTKISIKGAGIMGRIGIIAKLFETLSKANINLRVIATSEVKVSCIISARYTQKALRVISDSFELNDNQIEMNPNINSSDLPEVRGVALDPNQVQVSVKNIPNTPGSAAFICRLIADNGIIIDTIVQSERENNQGNKTISFTLKKEDRCNADQALKAILEKWPEAQIVDGNNINRVSAVGAGMPSTAGTAAKMFRALAKANINIEMIVTSEIRTTCIVSENNGNKALSAIHKEFNLNSSS